MIAAGFTWFDWVPLLGDDKLFTALGLHVAPHTGVLLGHTLLASAIVITLALLGRLALERQLAKPGIEKYFARPRLDVLTGFEVFATALISLMSDMFERKDIKKFFPFVASLFVYLLANNLFSLVPGFAPATDNINASFGIALVVAGVFLFVGLVRDAKSFIAHMWGPVFVVGFLLFPVELLSLAFRPVTLSLRITGNMFGDHTVFGVISGLAPAVVPVGVLGLALFVSFMQAFIFTLLTTMYISMAVPHHDDDHEAH